MPDGSRGRPAPLAHPVVVADSDSDIVVRPIVSRADCTACVALQHEIWGHGFSDAVPASILKASTRVGAIVAGAFAPDGELVGFVFGLPGILDGALVHWSHALGVRESARNGGVGRMLKEYQRAELARRGIDRMYWTFDPLLAKNAHLNLNRLGARIIEYVRDMYGSTTSPLHHGLETDRVVVVCETSRARAGTAPANALPPRRIAVLTPEPQQGDLVFELSRADRPHLLLLEIPQDMPQVSANAPERAALWLLATRASFEWALANGYAATGLHRDPVASRAYYVLEHPEQEGAA